jgi:hypothetical protein
MCVCVLKILRYYFRDTRVKKKTVKKGILLSELINPGSFENMFFKYLVKIKFLKK